MPGLSYRGRISRPQPVSPLPLEVPEPAPDPPRRARAPRARRGGNGGEAGTLMRIRCLVRMGRAPLPLRDHPARPVHGGRVSVWGFPHPARRARATGRRLRVTLWSHAVTLRSHIILPGYACATGALDGCQGGPIQRSIAIDRPAVTAAGASASGPGRRASSGALSAAIQREREPQARTGRRPCGRVPHPPFGDTRGEKAFVSQCAAEALSGDTQRK